MRELIEAPGKIISRIRRRGWRNAIRRIWWHLNWRYQEWRLGITTQGHIPWFELGNDPHNVDYEPIDYPCFKAMMRALPITPGEEVFLDYGCGKGRAIVLAATYPFKRVLGVERSATLYEVARENVGRASRHLSCHDIQIFCQDAAAYEVPSDVTFVFLFNPFTGPVLEAVIKRIRDSFLRRPRPITIIYVQFVTQQDELAGRDWVCFDFEMPSGPREGMRFLVYRTESSTLERSTDGSSPEVRECLVGNNSA